MTTTTPRKKAAPHADIAYVGAAKHFWNALGRDGGVLFALSVPGVTEAVANNREQTIRVTGSRVAINTAKAGLQKLWAEAIPALRDQDRKHAAKIKELRKTKEGRAERFAAEQKFLRDFAARAARPARKAAA